MSKHNISFEYTSPSGGRGVRKYLANLFLGLCVIAVGIGYLGNHIEALPWSGFTLFFPGWGALFLIIPAIYFLIRSPFSWFWPICLLIGVLIIISKLDLYPFGKAVAIGLAALIILVGIRIILAPIFKRARRKRIRRKIRNTLSGNGIYFGEAINSGAADGNYDVTFGERTIKPDGQDFTSATLSVKFGEMIFDLTDANIPDCAVIDATCSFGELSIRLPDYARAEVTHGGEAFCAEVACNHPQPRDTNAPVVYINATCSFGEINIR